MIMSKDEIIKKIKDLYPSNSCDVITALIGKELLIKAIFQCWENLPEEILFRYLQLCQIEEQKG